MRVKKTNLARLFVTTYYYFSLQLSSLFFILIMIGEATMNWIMFEVRTSKISYRFVQYYTASNASIQLYIRMERERENKERENDFL